MNRRLLKTFRRYFTLQIDRLKLVLPGNSLIKVSEFDFAS